MVRKTKYLTVPDSDYQHKSPYGSDISSETSRSQTPLLQQLYMSMTHWERIVGSNALDLNRKIKRKIHHKSKKPYNYSDVSSAEVSPKLSKSLKTYQKRKAPKLRLNKSLSLGSVNATSSSSDDDDDEDYDTLMLQKSLSLNVIPSSRSVSCPPGTVL